MRKWLVLGLAAALGIGTLMAGCRNKGNDAPKTTGRVTNYRDKSPSKTGNPPPNTRKPLFTRGYDRPGAIPEVQAKPVPAPAQPQPSASGRPARGFAGDAAYAAVPPARPYGRVPAVTTADWNQAPTMAHTARGPVMVAAAPTYEAPPMAARYEADGYAGRGVVATAVPAGLRAPALPPVPASQRTLAAMPMPEGAPATDSRLLAARQVMGMAAPAMDGVPRAEVTYASAGAVPAALRGGAIRTLPAPTTDWTSVELPPLGAERMFRMPMVSNIPATRPVASVDIPAEASRWLARASY